jgi:hypothetical protein
MAHREEEQIKSGCLALTLRKSVPASDLVLSAPESTHRTAVGDKVGGFAFVLTALSQKRGGFTQSSGRKK